MLHKKTKAIAFSVQCMGLLTLAACDPSENNPAVEAHDAPVEWRLASTYPASLILLGSLGERMTDQIEVISGGEFKIKFYAPGALLPPLELFDAISYGAVEAGWSTAGYWSGRVPALQLFSSVPFGPAAPEYLAWFDYGGGRELYNEIYHKQNIHGVICGITPPESAGWYKQRFDTLEELKGKKIRFFGLGGKVLEKIGASPQLLAGGDIFPALELGTIDGAEFSMPAVDLNMGFYQAAKYYYFPGWHQQSTLFEIMINLDAWNALSPKKQAQLENVCAANVRYGMSQGEAIQGPALERLAAEGVSIERFPPEVLAQLKAAWLEVAADLAAQDEDFARAWKSLQDFRKTYSVWEDLGYLKDIDADDEEP